MSFWLADPMEEALQSNAARKGDADYGAQSATKGQIKAEKKAASEAKKAAGQARAKAKAEAKGGGAAAADPDHPRGTGDKGGQFVSKGDEGKPTEEIQAKIGATVTGHYDAATASAVIAFQKKHGLVADGVVGRQTALALQGQYSEARKVGPGKLGPRTAPMVGQEYVPSEGTAAAKKAAKSKPKAKGRTKDRVTVTRSRERFGGGTLVEAAGVGPRSTMVALYPSGMTSHRLAVAGGESPAQIHLTLAFLGDVPDDKIHQVEEEVKRAVRYADLDGISGVISGPGQFLADQEKTVHVALVDAPSLGGLRSSIMGRLKTSGLGPREDHGFTPHMTLRYGGGAVKVDPGPVRFSEVRVVRGDETIARFPIRPRFSPLAEMSIDAHGNLHDGKGLFAKQGGTVGKAAAKSSPAFQGVPKYDASQLKFGKAAGGSNGARFADHKDGSKWLVKSYGGDEDRVAAEVASNAIYRHMGARVPEAGRIKLRNGKHALSYPLLDGKPRLYGFKNGEPSEEIGKHFMTDALLANWDVAGLEDDNILWDAEGNPFRVDQGGTLTYRAQGQPKPFGPEVKEVESLMKPGKQGARSSKVSPEGMRKQAAEIAERMTPAVIDGILESARFRDKKLQAQIAEALKGRVEWMRNFAASKIEESEVGPFWAAPFDLLQEKEIGSVSWNEALHPRNEHGRFVKSILGGLKAGDTVRLDAKTTIGKDKDGTFRVTRSGGITKGFKTPADAARDALDKSAKGTEVDGIGGATKFKSYNDYLKARGLNPDKWNRLGGEYVSQQDLQSERMRLEDALTEIKASDDVYVKRSLKTVEARFAEVKAKLKASTKGTVDGPGLKSLDGAPAAATPGKVDPPSKQMAMGELPPLQAMANGPVGSSWVYGNGNAIEKVHDGLHKSDGTGKLPSHFHVTIAGVTKRYKGAAAAKNALSGGVHNSKGEDLAPSIDLGKPDDLDGGFPSANITAMTQAPPGSMVQGASGAWGKKLPKGGPSMWEVEIGGEKKLYKGSSSAATALNSGKHSGMSVDPSSAASNAQTAASVGGSLPSSASGLSVGDTMSAYNAKAGMKVKMPESGTEFDVVDTPGGLALSYEGSEPGVPVSSSVWSNFEYSGQGAGAASKVGQFANADNVAVGDFVEVGSGTKMEVIAKHPDGQRIELKNASNGITTGWVEANPYLVNNQAVFAHPPGALGNAPAGDPTGATPVFKPSMPSDAIDLGSPADADALLGNAKPTGKPIKGMQETPKYSWGSTLGGDKHAPTSHLDLAVGDILQKSKGTHKMTVVGFGPTGAPILHNASGKKKVIYGPVEFVHKADGSQVGLNENGKAALAKANGTAPPTPSTPAPAATGPLPGSPSVPSKKQVYDDLIKKEDGLGDKLVGDYPDGAVIGTPSGKVFILQKATTAPDGFVTGLNIETGATAHVKANVPAHAAAGPSAAGPAKELLAATMNKKAADAQAAQIKAQNAPPKNAKAAAAKSAGGSAANPDPKSGTKFETPVGAPDAEWHGVPQDTQAKSIFEAHIKTQMAKVKPSQKSAIGAYTGSTYGPINKFMRHKWTSESERQHGEKLAKEMMEVFNDIDPIGQETIVYRKVTGKTGEFWKNAPIDATLPDMAFGSSSSSPDFAHGWGGGGSGTLLKMKLPADQKGLWVSSSMSSQGAGEKELVLPPGMHFKVLDSRVLSSGQRMLVVVPVKAPMPGMFG